MWYFLISNSDSYIEIQGSYDRVRNIFFSNQREPIENLELTAIAQEGLTKEILLEVDYLEDVIMGGIPVFSARFKEVIQPHLNREMDFVPCKVLVKNDSYLFYAVRINTIIPIIDYEKSGHRELARGGTIIDDPIIIKEDIDPNLLIVRDAKYMSNFVVSNTLKKLIEKENLKVGFYRD
mgnify:FL=1